MIEIYDNKKHYAKLCKWLAARGIAEPDKEFLSPIGYIVDEIAIGFLFTTNSPIAEIDNVAADPESHSEDREKALATLFRIIESEAASQGCKIIKGLAEIPTMIARFEKLKYRRHSQMTLFYKNIGGRKCLG